MELRNSRQKGYTLIELLVATIIFSIVLFAVASAFVTTLTTARDQQNQARLNSDLQVAAKQLDSDIRQTGFLLAASTYNTLPLYSRSSHPVAAVEILDNGKTLRCIRLGDESGGRLLEGIQPAGAVTDSTTEVTVTGNTTNLTTRIGISRAFIFISEGEGRKGKIFVTDAVPTADPTTPNVTHLHGSFTTSACLNVENSSTSATDYRGMVAIPISGFVEFRFEDEGLVRYEYSGAANPCTATPATFQKKLMISQTNFSTGDFRYLLADGTRVFPLADTSFPLLKGVMFQLKRRVRTQTRSEVTFANIPFILNDQW